MSKETLIGVNNMLKKDKFVPKGYNEIAKNIMNKEANIRMKNL